jgi:hypothetical protein
MKKLYTSAVLLTLAVVSAAQSIQQSNTSWEEPLRSDSWTIAAILFWSFTASALVLLFIYIFFEKRNRLYRWIKRQSS